MQATQGLSASLEDYLEAIFHIASQKQAARPTDIARRLGVNSSSVTGALHALAERGLVNHAPYDLVTLTERGQRSAERVVRKHEALRDFFVKVLSVDEAEADDAACKMEHAVPSKILERFVGFVEFIEGRPPDGVTCIRDFADQLDFETDDTDMERDANADSD